MTTIWTQLTDNTTAWGKEPKPFGTTSVIVTQYSGGQPIGLLLSLTQSSVIGQSSVVTHKWSSITVGTTTWTDVPKAT